VHPHPNYKTYKMTVTQRTFRQHLLAKKQLVGTFQKTPSMMVSEVIASTSIDVVCIDAEHSPFDRRDLDSTIFAYRSTDKPSLVRVQSGAAEHILNVLDSGATGVVVPHVDSVEKAESIAKSARYGDMGRGYAGSTRAANYTGNTVSENLANNKNNVVIAQIEDLAALDEIDGIAVVEGIDCLFIGMMDLTVALGCNSPKDQPVVDAAKKICIAANKVDRRLGIFVADLNDVGYWRELGVTLFLLGSEHGFIKQGINHLLAKTKPNK
jgi:2-keto-3-deoxy-L-rhamnonate aldolase RhmA